MSHAVILSPDPTSSAGGVERMCALLAGVLRDAGWQVTIVGPRSESARWQSCIGLGYLMDSCSATVAALKLKPDLIISNGMLGMGSSRRVPRVHVYHGTMIGDTRAESTSLSRRERVRRMVGGGLAEALGGRGATVVCVSEATAREVRRFFGVKTDAVIPNGVDTAVFCPRPRAAARERMGLSAGGRYGLFVGRTQDRKGADLLPAACREAGFELLIAGAKGAPGAHHLGVLAPDELADAYAAADCILFPSRYEGFGLVALEALACERPLVMTKVGWMPTFLRALPEYEVLCVRPEHADIVAHLLKLEELDTEKLTSRARAWILEHNSLEHYAEHWQNLLHQQPCTVENGGDLRGP